MSCTFDSNAAQKYRSAINELVWGNGAAILFAQSTDPEAISSKVADSVFAANYTGTGRGGAIYTERDVEVDRCVFSQNHCHKSARGGAIYVTAGATAEIRRSAFASNFACQDVPFITSGGATWRRGKEGRLPPWGRFMP